MQFSHIVDNVPNKIKNIKKIKIKTFLLLKKGTKLINTLFKLILQQN